VGVKTYGLSSESAKKKSEKIAEFTRDAREGVFSGLPGVDLAREVAQLRNARLASDAAELGIGLEGAYYHSLVRVPGGAYINEVAMGADRISRDPRQSKHTWGARQSRCPRRHYEKHLVYVWQSPVLSFTRSKNALFRKFDFSEGWRSPFIPLFPMPQIWERLIDGSLTVEGGYLDEAPKALPATVEEIFLLCAVQTGGSQACSIWIT
jgi:hypothetical protein